MKVINFDDLTQDEIKSFSALEDFIMTGLRRAGVLAEDDEDGYTEGQLVEGPGSDCGVEGTIARDAVGFGDEFWGLEQQLHLWSFV